MSSNASDDPAEALKKLIAKRAIEDVLFSYCQGVDRREWDQVLAAYHDDASDTHGEFSGSPAQLVEWMQHSHEHVSFCMHTLSNVSVRFASDDLARVESYCISRKTVASAEFDPYLRGIGASGPARRTVGCRYVDTFERRAGVGWRISSRIVLHEWMRLDPAENFVEFGSSVALSRRDRDDPLFAAAVASAAASENLADAK